MRLPSEQLVERAGRLAAAAGVFFLMADQVIRMTVTLVLGIGS